jgi:hypothetical protein
MAGRIARALGVTLGLLLAWATFAAAAGVDLSFDACSFVGSATRTSACNSNTGQVSLYASFVPPNGIVALSGIEATIDVQSGGGVLPAWWMFGAGGCAGRSSALSTSFVPTGPPSGCVDYWAGQAFGSASYSIGFGGPNRARLLVSASIDGSLAAAVSSTNEYFAFVETISFASTLGSGSCAGCDVGVCIALNSIKLRQAGGQADVILPGAFVRQHVTWQPASAIAPPPCPAGTPVRAATWGGIKAIYR